MKRLLIFVLLGTTAFAATQNRLVYRDSKKNPRIQIEGNNGFFAPEKSFELSGNVVVKQLEDKLTMSCGKATGDFVKIENKSEFDKVRLTGGVKANQEGKGSSLAASSTSANYDLNGSLRTLVLNGNVKLDFSGTSEVKGTKKDSVMSVDASSANVVFRKTNPDAKKNTLSIESAEIDGPITFDGVETSKADGKVKKQKISVKASKLTFTAKGESDAPEVRLTGNLEIHEEDENGEGPEISGARLLILQLDKDFNIVKVKFSSDGVGQIRSVFNTKSGKGN